MSGGRSRNGGGGSRYLYEPFDAATARIEANERVIEERWAGLERRLNAIELMLERLERRLWLAVYGVAATVVAQLAYAMLNKPPL
tara:strand:+ start:6 stop:260 length:255 start_codon:yes stop_codon:yes gene_type:complete